jgi:ferredoxin-type protein NapF
VKTRRELLLQLAGQQPGPDAMQRARAAVDGGCLAKIGVHCRSCEDACPELAIRFRPALGSVPQPEIDADACTGCAACLPACPQGAIQLQQAGGPS